MTYFSGLIQKQENAKNFHHCDLQIWWGRKSKVGMFTDQMFSNKVCNYKNVCLINLLSFGFKYRQSSENKSNQAKFY